MSEFKLSDALPKGVRLALGAQANDEIRDELRNAPVPKVLRFLDLSSAVFVIARNIRAGKKIPKLSLGINAFSGLLEYCKRNHVKSTMTNMELDDGLGPKIYTYAIVASGLAFPNYKASTAINEKTVLSVKVRDVEVMGADFLKEGSAISLIPERVMECVNSLVADALPEDPMFKSLDNVYVVYESKEHSYPSLIVMRSDGKSVFEPSNAGVKYIYILTTMTDFRMFHPSR